VTALERRLSKLEMGRQPAAHRPPGMSIDTFISHMLAALPPLDTGINPSELDRAAAPWFEAMTVSEAQDLVTSIDAVLAARRKSKTGGDL
jgi:hypothetical protein